MLRKTLHINLCSPHKTHMHIHRNTYTHTVCTHTHTLTDVHTHTHTPHGHKEGNYSCPLTLFSSFLGHIPKLMLLFYADTITSYISVLSSLELTGDPGHMLHFYLTQHLVDM